MTAPMLRHFDPSLKIRIETDASGFAVSAIITQLNPETGQWHPIAYWSRKMTDPERNYGIGEAEMLAIVGACRQWRHYVEGAAHPIEVITDHANLRTFLTSKNLNRREARWWERLSGLDLQIIYRPGKLNPADAPSRRSDYAPLGEAETLLATLSGSSQTIIIPSLNTGGGALLTATSRPHPKPGIVSEELLRNGAQTPWDISRSAFASLVPKEGSSVPSAGTTRSPSELTTRRDSSLKGENSTTLTDLREPAEEAWSFQLADVAGPQTLASKHTVKEVTQYETAYAVPSLELRTVLQILQEADHLVQEKQPLTAQSELWEREDRESTDDRLVRRDSVQSDTPPAQLRQPEGAETARQKYVNSMTKRKWHMDGELLCYNEKWYVPAGLLRRRLLERNHDDPFAGHFGFDRTLDLIRRKYYWAGMYKDVKHYVETCAKCHRAKAVRHKPWGQLSSLPLPRAPFSDMTMDFITDLPPSMRRGLVSDSILVAVDRYTKFAIYIPSRMDWSAEIMADAVFDLVYGQHGMPENWVTDRGSLFTSHFWETFCAHLSILCRYSSAFHPQTDGQTERQNQTLEQYLRTFVNYQQDDWAQWLIVAAFAYNNSVHTTTGVSPFFAAYGRHPRWEEEIKDVNTDIPAARVRAEGLTEMRRMLEAR